MGTFWGHFYEAVVFTLLALWWLVHMIINYIKSLKKGKPYVSQLSYPLHIRGCTIPLEIIAKLGCFAFGSISGPFVVGFDFINDEGDFRYLDILQHSVILGLAFIHAVSDLLDYLGLSVNRDLKYVTASLSYAWCGAAFYLHSDPITGKGPLELILHRLMVPLMLSTALVWLVEMFKRDSVTIQMIRCFTVLTIGTWFGFMSHVLWGPFPGRSTNLDWDRDNERNVHFVQIAFGIHLMVNVLIILIPFYIAESYRKYAKLGRKCCTCVPMDDRQEYGGCVNDYERVKLLEEE